MEETQGNYGGIMSINVIIIYHKKIKHLKEICAWAGFQSAKRTMVRAHALVLAIVAASWSTTSAP